MAGAAVLGTLFTPASADARVMMAASSGDRTLSKPVTTVTKTVDSRIIPEALQDLRTRSLLSWGEIAGALSVSRRTVHNWLNGGAISARHMERLFALENIVWSAYSRSPDAPRVWLLKPGTSGRSPLAEFARGSTPLRKVSHSTVRPADLLEPSVLDDLVTGDRGRPSRASSIKGGLLPRSTPDSP
jgi:DNA-binding transcriptional regulator YiaG